MSNVAADCAIMKSGSWPLISSTGPCNLGSASEAGNGDRGAPRAAFCTPELNTPIVLTRGSAPSATERNPPHDWPMTANFVRRDLPFPTESRSGQGHIGPGSGCFDSRATPPRNLFRVPELTPPVREATSGCDVPKFSRLVVEITVQLSKPVSNSHCLMCCHDPFCDFKLHPEVHTLRLSPML